MDVFNPFRVNKCLTNYLFTVILIEMAERYEDKKREAKLRVKNLGFIFLTCTLAPRFALVASLRLAIESEVRVNN
jgi:hypothetical protein